MKILLLSAYDAESHRHWHQFLEKNMPHHKWQILTLPPRFFNWRIRGNSLTWAFDPSLTQASDFDCLIATSMTDLSSLRGMRPDLSSLPTLLYFHENQFAYPSSSDQHQSLEPQMVQLYSAICADILVFNSYYNQSTFLEGVELLLKKLPDGIPKGIVDGLKEKSRCIAVPISDVLNNSGSCNLLASDPVHIVWNHRWEYDKGPELLEALIERLSASLPVRFHIVGQQFRSSPKAFDRIRHLLHARSWLGQWGFLEVREYERLLAESDIVLSTAKHDFQGLSILQAVAFGCMPVVPDALVYPEWFDAGYRYSIENVAADNLSAHITQLVGKFKSGCQLSRPSLEPFFWPHLEEKYEAVLLELKQLQF